MEIQQSVLYTHYLKALHWNVDLVDNTYIFSKKIPFLGTIAKLQRSLLLPDVDTLAQFLKHHRVRSLSVEPDSSVDQKIFHLWLNKISHVVRINSSPFLPTKTIRVDLSGSEDEIFQRFSEAKRRAVRRAQKNNLRINESTNIQDLIKIKNKSSGFLGFITTTGIDKLWPIFAPDHAAILLAYKPHSTFSIQHSAFHIIGGVLLLFLDKVAYYWIAGSTKEGKKLFAPTLLVWEALKLSKKRGMKQFDFVGIWDQRMPKQFHEWKGFTKFKEGFGGKELYYPISSEKI